MKRLVLCLFAAASMLFATENVNAQKVNFGLKGGLNLSNWSTNDSEMKIGFHAGGYAQIKFNKMFAVQPEVLYSMEGNKTFNETTTTILGKEYYARYTDNITVNKIAVPVMVQISPISRFTIEVGPQFNFNLAMRGETIFETNAVGETSEETTRKYDNEGFELFELGLAAGLKFDLTNTMSIGARYVYGLTPLIGEITMEDIVVSDAVTTSNIMVSFNFGF